MEESVYESLSFREEQEKIKQKLSFQIQNIQKNQTLDDSMLSKSLDCQLESSAFHQYQDQSANFQLNQQENNIVLRIDLQNQEQQNPVNIQFLSKNEIILLSPIQSSSNESKEVTPYNPNESKSNLNPQIFKQNQIEVEAKNYQNSTNNQFLSPTNDKKSTLFQNNQFLSEAYVANAPKNLQNTADASKTQISNKFRKQSQQKARQILNKFSYVKKFINRLKERSKRLLFKSISAFQFNIINDLSSDLDFYLKRNYINQTKIINLWNYLFQGQFFGQSFQTFLEGKYLFSLYSLINIFIQKDTLLMQMWDIFVILFTIALIVTVPVLHLQVFQDSQMMIIFHDHVIVWFLIIEVLLRLNTEIYSNGINIRDRRQIFQKNMNNLKQIIQIFNQLIGLINILNQSSFILDIEKIPNFLFEAIEKLLDFLILILYCISTSKSKQSFLCVRFFDYIVFLKYLNIPRKVSEFESKLQISDSTKNWMKLIKLEIIVLTLAHVFCCIFLNIGLHNNSKGLASWITKTELHPNSLWDLYFLSLYYMVITICTIGYGDIYPYQLNEKLYIAFVSLLATNVTAYAFSQISEIVKFESTKNQKFNNYMTDINNQMKNIGLGINLQSKVRKHFEFLYYQNECKQQISDSIVDKLPNNLKNEVLLDVYKEKINSIKMFQEFSSDCLKNILLSFKQKQLFPDEIIVNQQENSENLYFLISGNLEISFQIKETKSGKVYEKSNQKIQKSEAFGYEGFLLGQRSPYMLKSIGSSLISYIEINSFLEILKQYPDDCEKFYQIKDQAIFGQKNEFFKFSECISCGKQQHQISVCPYLSLNLTYKPSKESNQRNQQFLRKRDRFRNTLKNINYLQQKAMAAQANNDDSTFIDAYNICLNPVLVSGDQIIDSQTDFSSIFLSNNDQDQVKNSQILSNQKIPITHSVLSEKLIIAPAQQLNQKLNFQNDEKVKLSREVSIQVEENSLLDQLENKVNQNTLIYEQEKYSDLKSKETANFNDDSCNFRASNKSILLSEEAQKEKFSISNDKTTQEKFNGISLYNSTEKQSSQLSGQFKINKINTFLIEPSQNYFEEPEIFLLKQAFQKRKQKSLKQYDNFQRSLSEKVFIQNKSGSLNQKKQNLLLLDILMNLKDKKQKPQQNNIPNIQSQEHLDKLISQILSFHQTNIDNQQLNLSSNQNLLSQNTKPNEEQYQQIDNLTEYLIRQKSNLQDIDMLVVRKQFQLQQQQNKIQNFIMVPDNEIDIDRLQNYKYYHVNYNYKFVLNRFKNFQDKMNAQQLNKLKKHANKKQKIKMTNQISKQLDN